MPDAGGMSPFPSYDSMTDWLGGTFGNDVNVAFATYPNDIAAYGPRTQSEKAATMVPAGTLAENIIFDYGDHQGQMGRTGTIEPKTPYPDGVVTSVLAVSAENPAVVTVSDGAVLAGATTVTIWGNDQAVLNGTHDCTVAGDEITLTNVDLSGSSPTRGGLVTTP